MRQALYRTYRPRRFRDVVGQDVPVRILKEAVRQGALTHAYLLCGPRGTGKTSVARILAQAATCEQPEGGEPCGTCASCVAAEQGTHLDIMEIDGASNRGIDEVRQLRERVWHLPAQGRMKAYIIDEVHMLTDAAFNAFLKTLEEPPPHVLFIFATTEPHRLPITVLSRCQRYDFGRIPAPVIRDNLRAIVDSEGVAADENALLRIAQASEGGLRDAQSMLDQCLAAGPVTEESVSDMLGALDEGHLGALVDAILAGQPGRVLDATDQAYAAGRDPRYLLRDTAERLRDLWVRETLGEAALGDFRAARLRVHPVSAVRGADAWFQALQELAEAEARLRSVFSPRLVIELGLMKAMLALAAEPTRQFASAEPSPVRHDPPAAPVSPVPEPAPDRAPAPGRGRMTGPGRFEDVVHRLKKRSQLTAALFRSVDVDDGGDPVRIGFQYPAHHRVLDDEKSGHRKAFLDAFHEVYGNRGVTFHVSPVSPVSHVSEANEASSESGPDPRVARVRELFGPNVTVEVLPEEGEEG